MGRRDGMQVRWRGVKREGWRVRERERVGKWRRVRRRREEEKRNEEVKRALKLTASLRVLTRVGSQIPPRIVPQGPITMMGPVLVM